MPDAKALASLAHETGVDLNWLLNDEDPTPEDEWPVLEKDLSHESDDSEENEKPEPFTKVALLRIAETTIDNEYPLIGYAAASTRGYGGEEFELAHDETITVPAEAPIQAVPLNWQTSGASTYGAPSVSALRRYVHATDASAAAVAASVQERLAPARNPYENHTKEKCKITRSGAGSCVVVREEKGGNCAGPHCGKPLSAKKKSRNSYELRPLH